MKICENCEYNRWSWTCEHKNNYYDGTCELLTCDNLERERRKQAGEQYACGDLVLGCEKYKCSLAGVCMRAYERGMLRMWYSFVAPCDRCEHEARCSYEDWEFNPGEQIICKDFLEIEDGEQDE